MSARSSSRVAFVALIVAMLAVLAPSHAAAEPDHPAAPQVFALRTGSGGGAFGGFGVTVLGSGANELVGIDTASGAATVVTGGLPSGIHNFAAALDPAGSRLFYRAASGAVVTVDTTTGAVLSSVSVAANLASLEYDASSDRLLGLVTGNGEGSVGGFGLTLFGAGANDVVSIDPASGAVTSVASGLASGIHNFAAAFDAGGSRLFYRAAGGALVTVDTAGGAVLSSVPVGANLVSLDYEASSERLLGLVTGSGPGSVGGFGLTLFGAGANDLVSIDPASGAVTTVASGLPSGIHNFAAALDPAGSRLVYRASGPFGSPSDELVTVDTASGEVLGRVPTAGNLVSLAVAGAITPEARLGQLESALGDIVSGSPGTPLADKVEDAFAKVVTALSELSKQPAERQAALGALEGAAGDLESAVKDGVLSAASGTELLQQLGAAARQLASEAINQAVARGATPASLAAAEQALEVGDAAAATSAYKHAIASYKDVLAKAESA